MNLRLLLRRAIPAIAVAVVLAAVITASWLSATHGVRWQWASAGTATLGSASEQLAARLDAPVTVTVALPEGHLLRRHVERLGAAYRRHHAAFEVTFLDPQTEGDRARELGLVRTGEALVQLGEGAERIVTPSEARMSAALERLMRQGERFVAFLTGSGARDLLGDANYDLGRFGEALGRKGYRLQPLDAATTGAIPDNASLLIVAGPDRPLDAVAVLAIRRHLADGGALLWLAEPGGAGPAPALPVTASDTALEDATASARLGIDDPRFLLLETLPPHPVNEGLTSPLLLVGGATLTPAGNSGDWRSDTVLGRPGDPNTAAADRSDRPLGLALQRGSTRAVVLGDSDLLANAYVGNGDNLAFGLQVVDWVTGAEDYIGTYLNPARDQRLALTPASAAVLGGVLLLGLPGLLLALAGWRWYRLRRD